MGFALVWIVLALVCAGFVLAIAGRVTRGSASSEASMWAAWGSDIAYAIEPLGLQIKIALTALGSADDKDAKRAELLEQQAAMRQERRQDRDIAKMAQLGRSDESNSSLGEFLRATSTEEPAYFDPEVLTDKLESFYESVQDRRESHRTAVSK
jgi:hypothetical protein